MGSNSYDTIIIGLGVSGVTAASTLVQAGRRVLGLEAQGRIGGRVETVPFGDGVVELGAEWIHGERPSRVFDLAVRQRVALVPQELVFEAYRSDGALANKELVNELTMYCLEVVDNPPVKPEPLGRFVTNKLMEYLKHKRPEVLDDKDFLEHFLQFINLLMNNYEASNDWDDVSAWTKYQELEGHQHLSWNRHGYRTLFEILLNKYNNGPGLPTLDIKLNTEATRVSWSQDPTQRVVVSCKDGATYMADNVIVTVSLGVLKERHTTLFSPSLPQKKICAIENTSMGLIDKIILSFSRRWWPRNPSFYAFIWRGDDKSQLGPEDYWTGRIFGASCPMGSSNSLTLWTNGDVAKLVETLPEDVVKRKCVDLLRKFMGANVTIPEPTGMVRSTWFSNPYTRGSYTYDNLDVAKHPFARAELARPLLDSAGTPRVLFAGEATDDTHFSTVHGAADSGYREAKRVLRPTRHFWCVVLWEFAIITTLGKRIGDRSKDLTIHR